LPFSKKKFTFLAPPGGILNAVLRGWRISTEHLTFG